MLRFHLDESFPVAVAAGLVRRGLDVTTSRQVGLLGVTVEEQLAYALRELRVLLTRDRDFLRLNAQGVEHAGIVYVQPGRGGYGRIIGELNLIAADRELDELRGLVLYL